MRSAVTAVAIATGFSSFAEAQGGSVFADATVSTSLQDRGAQLSRETLELLAGIERPTSFGTAYAAVYRIEPLGTSRSVFSPETDYSLGFVLEGKRYTADLSANWLTYPGTSEDSTLELVAAIELDLWGMPHIIAFGDMHTDDKGLEVSAGPSRKIGDWSIQARARTGLVGMGDGSPTRTYAGLEASARRILSDRIEFGLIAAFDISDQDTLSADIRSGEITAMGQQGLSAGAFLSFAH
ncbi:hypothetical protein [Hyphomonas sp.]|uniref:hypothetical protein n=1 Tax=Hyphomonas sp. TaxID=87 RepID=UPI00300299E9